MIYTKETLAALLNGREYGDEISQHQERDAKASGLLVVFGASDDLIEFRGIIHDEEYPGQEGTINFNYKGILDSHDDCECQWCGYEDAVKKCASVQAQWCKEKGYSWTYKTKLPNATFEIVEGREKYCRGIVIDVKDLPK